MTATLQEAIAAARGGDMEQALLLAADIAQEHPDDANAWYLLSQLVDSDARRAAYLSKTLAIAPGHERARTELAALPPDLIETLGAGEAMSMPEPAVLVGAAVESGSDTTASGVPEWLRPLGAEAVQAAPQPVAAAEPVAPPVAHRPATRPKPRTPPPPPPRRRGNQALAFLLVLLVLLTLLVLVFLGYLLLA